MVTKARENARSVQEHISREVWLSVNKYYLHVSGKNLTKRKLEREKDQLESVLKQVEDLNLSLKMQSEEDNKLFGSVTKIDIVKLLEENGITIDKKYIDLSSPIKTLGEHKVNIVFTKEMSGSFTLAVEKED